MDGIGGINRGRGAQKTVDFGCECRNFCRGVVAEDDGFFEMPVRHAADVDEKEGGEEVVGEKDEPFFDVANRGFEPADLFDVSFKIFFGEEDLVTEDEGARDVEKDSAAEVGHDVFAGKPDRGGADTAKGKKGCGADAESLEDDQSCDDDHADGGEADNDARRHRIEFFRGGVFKIGFPSEENPRKAENRSSLPEWLEGEGGW